MKSVEVIRAACHGSAPAGASPQAVVRRLIPKGGGKFRPLGLPALADKIVAKAVGMLLEAIYEQ